VSSPSMTIAEKVYEVKTRETRRRKRKKRTIRGSRSLARGDKEEGRKVTNPRARPRTNRENKREQIAPYRPYLWCQRFILACFKPDSKQPIASCPHGIRYFEREHDVNGVSCI
jgi:hypothetical protein